MADGLSGPRLRAVEAFPTVVDGAPVVCLRDPSGVTEAVLTVPQPVVEILALLDGTRSLLDVQAEIMRRHGALVARDQLDRLVGTLDQHFFLEGQRLEAERQRLAAAFRTCPTRPAVHAGRAYAADADELARALDGFFAHPDGPGPAGPPGTTRLHGLIAPHIDFARGGSAYAWAYKAVAEAADIDCFVVFGTAHAGLDGQAFAATRKPYDTPFGRVAVDDEVLAALAKRTSEDLFAAELAHRSEHSIEFQAVWLGDIRRRRDREVRIVPILTSFVHECLARGLDPAAHPAVRGVLEALRETMAAVPRRYCLVAGADLAHMGPRFGDSGALTAAHFRWIEAEDRALLSIVAEGDADRFFAAVVRDGDRRRVCGLSPIYAVLRALPGGPGRLLQYRQWPDPEATVTFASLAFAEPAG